MLTLNVRGPSYLGLTKSISWLLMPWLLTSPGPGLTWGRILRTCDISMWSNGIKCKYMFMFHLKNLACKGLIISGYHVGPLFQNMSSTVMICKITFLVCCVSKAILMIEIDYHGTRTCFSLNTLYILYVMLQVVWWKLLCLVVFKYLVDSCCIFTHNFLFFQWQDFRSALMKLLWRVYNATNLNKVSTAHIVILCCTVCYLFFQLKIMLLFDYLGLQIPYLAKDLGQHCFR